MIQSKTRMNLEYYHDFYILQGLQNGIRSEISRNPEKGFSKAVEKLIEDLDEYANEFFDNIALRSFVYLYAVCLGEARHARESLAKTLFIPEILHEHREGIYKSIFRFRPTKQNIDVLIKVFSQKWSSGFGGKAWLNIAKALNYFFTGTASGFVDHIIDLEHNGGCVFNKSETRSTIYFDPSYPNSFKDFLDWKFRYDVLKDCPPLRDFSVTRKTRFMVTRFCNIFGKKDPEWMQGTLKALDEYRVEWGDENLSLVEKWMPDVDVSNGNIPNVSYLFEVCHDSDTNINEMLEKEVKKYAKNLKKDMYEKAGNFLNGNMKILINKKVSNWLEWAVQYCKQPKKAVTYQVLPCQIIKIETEAILEVLVPYDGYGKETENGFLVDGFHLHPSYFTEPVTDAHLEAHGDGTIILYANGLKLTKMDKKLEAFID